MNHHPLFISLLLLIGVATGNAQTQVTVAAGERIAITPGSEIDVLTVYGNEFSKGEVRIENNGIAKIKKFVYKHTFTPERWNYLSFPAVVNIDSISNLKALGYTYNAEGTPTWYLRTFNESKGNIGTGWENLLQPVVEPNRGYIMAVGKEKGSEPVEVTFTFDNVTLDFEQNIKTVSVSLDLSNSQAGTQKFYISPKGIKGNVLAIDVNYQPTQTSAVPRDYQTAVEEARLITFDKGKQFRLSLPTSEKAEIYILDKKGEKVIEAYHYQSPAAIDVSKLRRGSYPVVIRYGNGVAVKNLECKL